MTIKTDAGNVLFSTDSTFIGTSLLQESVGSSLTRSKRTSKASTAKPSGVKKEIVFPIFDKIAQLQTNDKWRQIFDDMATAKYPRYMTTSVDRNYTGNKDSIDPEMKILTLVYKYRKVEKSLEVFNNPSFMSKELKKFIRETTGNDYDDDPDTVKDDSAPVSFVAESKTHWSKLKPKDRELRLKGFIARYAKDKKLTSEQQEDLETELILLNISKGLPEEIVRLSESGEIVHISGIRMDDTGSFSVGRE